MKRIGVIMKKMRIAYVILIILSCSIHCDHAIAATNTSGVERSLLQNVVVESLLA